MGCTAQSFTFCTVVLVFRVWGREAGQHSLFSKENILRNYIVVK